MNAGTAWGLFATFLLVLLMGVGILVQRAKGRYPPQETFAADVSGAAAVLIGLFGALISFLQATMPL